MKKLLIITIGFFTFTTTVFAQKKDGAPDTSKHQVFYTCPIHKQVKVQNPISLTYQFRV